jgi:hypothetical protein
MDRVWADQEELAGRGIHLLTSNYDEQAGRWIELEVVTTAGEEAERSLRRRYSDLIRLKVLGRSLTEEHPTPWQTFRVDEHSVHVAYTTSGHHRGARAEVTETGDAVTITLIETRSVGPYGPVLRHMEHAVRLARPLGGGRVLDGSSPPQPA